MLKIAWMSDLHFARDGFVLGHDPRRRLMAAIAHINAHHADAVFCVVSGDMANRGTEADYRALADLLGTLDTPVMPMVGNHDDRALLRAALPLPAGAMAEFVQYPVAASEGLVLCLDTQKTGSDAGVFCAARRDWLQETLEQADKQAVYLFMHHPPMPLGLPAQDTENLSDGKEFLDLLDAHDNVRHLFLGHVHRPITGTVRGIPFATLGSVLYQAPAPRPAWDWESFKPAAEAPKLGVLTIETGNVNLQYEQFCDYATGGA